MNAIIVMRIFFLVIGQFGGKAEYLDGDVQLRPLSSTPSAGQLQSRRCIGNMLMMEITVYIRFSAIPSLPGLEIRINSKGFLYASLLAGAIVNNEIKRFRLQPLKQCFQRFNGCITISNLVISRYRCSQLTFLHPSPPNRIVLIVRNLDLEAKAKVNGDIGVVLPIKLDHTVYSRIRQISATVQFTIHHRLNGSLYVRIVECYLSAGFSDVSLDDDGLVGNIFNGYFRGTAAEQIRRQLPITVCEMIQNAVEEKINAPLHTLPKHSKLINIAKKIINSITLANLSNKCHTSLCMEKVRSHGKITHFSTVTKSLNILSTVPDLRTSDEPRHLSSLTHTQALRNVTSSSLWSTSQVNVYRMDSSTFLDPCAGCNFNDKSILSYNFNDFEKYIDKVLANTVLNMSLIKVSATPDHFQLGLRANFGSKGKVDEMPFQPLPMHFPTFSDERSKQISNAIVFQIDPETPKLGGLLKTTCSDEHYDDFDDFDINMGDEGFDDNSNTTVLLANFMKSRRRRSAMSDSDGSDKSDKAESKEDEDIFGDLGVCIGDIMPAVRDKYPRKLIHIRIGSRRAPTIALLAENDGKARIDLELEAVLYIDDSGENVGTMLISSVIDGNVRISGNRISILIEIQSLKLVDKEDTLGLPPDALDNLANLAKDIIAQTANNELANGFLVELATGRLPYKLVKPKFAIIDHAIHIATDFSIPASTLGITSSSICQRF
ncbi:unnamed protein product [Litomosoides sigmodontis]|uniref:Lipid-binding serum glycoprotein N-terminal domain-containing protein n=1 Tax=Litomosoides sigmodontis TaxID=42156 RepID=A0A3P6T3A1_LITSI|nr:unnamed protein product [Litomosoides sigmodontis]